MLVMEYKDEVASSAVILTKISHFVSVVFISMIEPRNGVTRKRRSRKLINGNISEKAYITINLKNADLQSDSSISLHLDCSVHTIRSHSNMYRKKKRFPGLYV
jgi:hypothetical protein